MIMFMQLCYFKYGYFSSFILEKEIHLLEILHAYKGQVVKITRKENSGENNVKKISSEINKSSKIIMKGMGGKTVVTII